MKRKLSRMVCLVLTAVMLLSAFPAQALAAAPQEETWAYDPDTGRLAIDYRGFLSQHDVVYETPALDGETESMAAANGRTGVNVWHDKGLRMQIQSVDNAPNSAFSAAQVRLHTVPILEGRNFAQRLNLYDGYVSISQDNGFRAEIFGIPGTETMAIHVKDTRPQVESTMFDIEMWKDSREIITKGGTTEYEAWQTIDYHEKDGIVGFTKGIGQKEPFGYAFAVTVDGAEAMVLPVGEELARLYITPPESGEYTIWMSAFSRYHLEEEKEGSVYKTTGEDVFAGAVQELKNARKLGCAAAMEQFQAWWHEYWERSFIRYETSKTAESDYLENFYYTSQYHFGGTSDASFPAHWMNGVYRADRDQDMVWNIGYWHFNQRALYSGAMAANHVDRFCRHVDFYNRLKEVMTEYTRQRFGYENAAKTSETLRWDGYPKKYPLNANEDFSNPIFNMFENEYVGWIYSTGPEIAENMYHIYKYTQDKDLLAKYYDYMKRTVSFITQWARWDADKQMYRLIDSSALEAWWHVENSTPDNAAVRSLVPKFVEAAQILGKTQEDRALIQKAQDILEHLQPLSRAEDGLSYATHQLGTGTWGNIQNPELEFLFPHNISGLDYPDYEVAKKTYERRTASMYVWCVDGVHAARLGLGDESNRVMGDMISRTQYRPSGFTDDQNGRMEPMGQHITTLNEMYLQSYDELIRIFPAAPTDKAFNGAFTLLAKGGFLVSSEYSQGQPRYVALLSQYGGDARVKIPWADASSVLVNGQETQVTDGVLTVSSQKGDKILIQPLDQKDRSFTTVAISGTPNEAPKSAFSKTLGIADGAKKGTSVSYDFEDSTDDGVFTDSLSGNDGKICKNVKTVPGKDGGTAVDLTGGFVQIEHSSTFNPTDEFILSMDVKSDAGDFMMCLFDKCAPLGQVVSSGYYMDVYDTNVRVIAGAYFLLIPREKILDGQWHNVAVTYSTSMNKVEATVDGRVEATAQAPTPIPVVAAPGRLGETRMTDAPFKGVIDNFKIVPIPKPEPEDLVPVAADDRYNVKFDTELFIPFPGVFENDTDEEPEGLIGRAVTQPAHGTLQFLGDGGFRYVPQTGFKGSDSFTYTVTDGKGQTSAPATVRLDVGMSPVAQDDRITGYFGETVTGNLLTNDTAADGEALTGTVKAVFVPTAEVPACPVELGEDGSFTYTADPLPEEPGVYPDIKLSFTYQVETVQKGKTYVSTPAQAVIRITRHSAEPSLHYDFETPFENGKIRDVSAGGNDGLIVGSGVKQTREGTCKIGSLSYVKIPHSDTLDLYDEFEIRMNLKTDGKLNQVLFDKSNVPGNQVTRGFYVDLDAGFIRVFSDPVIFTSVQAPFRADRFMELRIRYSTSEGFLKIFADGELLGSAPVTEPLPCVSSCAFIGKKLAFDSHYMRAELADVRIMSTAAADSMKPVTGVTLDRTEATLEAGQTLTLLATVEPAYAENPTIAWSSSDETVATVEDGTVTAVGKGTAVITAQAQGDISASCTVEVTLDTAEAEAELDAARAAKKDILVTDRSAEEVEQGVRFVSPAADGALTEAIAAAQKALAEAKTPAQVQAAAADLLKATETYKAAIETGTYVQPPYVNPFEDVHEKDWFYDPVRWAAENGITAGVTATRFGPGKFCTRAQAVTFLWRAAGEPRPQSTGNPFTDLNEKEYYMDAILWAVEQGITQGVSADRFAPDQTCTRAQIVTFLWRYAGKPAPESTDHPFRDLNEKEYYMNPVLWAVENEITVGITDTTFGPNKTCTRGQIVTFLYRSQVQ